jgi:hypothetical protein
MRFALLTSPMPRPVLPTMGPLRVPSLPLNHVLEVLMSYIREHRYSVVIIAIVAAAVYLVAR